MRNLVPGLLLTLLFLFNPLLNAQERDDVLAAAKAAANSGQVDEAESLLISLADEGDVEAAFALGELILQGNSHTYPVTKAVEFLEKAAEGGLPKAYLRLGQVFQKGFGDIPENTLRAKVNLQNAAELGEAHAWCLLGKMDEQAGELANAKNDRDRYFSNARNFYENGAIAGDIESQYKLALLLFTSNGGEVNKHEAIKWLQVSARSGLPEAMNELGVKYQSGDGVEADSIMALGWLLASAERGNALAMTHMGLCYLNGIGVPVNIDRAGNWFSMASQQNEPWGRYFLGKLFDEGRGTDPNPIFAYVNYYFAAEVGLKEAIQARDTLRAKMSDDQLNEAQALIEKQAGGS